VSGFRHTLDWDEEDRLTRVTDASSAPVEFRYNADGQRTHKVQGGTSTTYVSPFWTVSNGVRGTRHVFAGDVRIASEIDVPNAVAGLSLLVLAGRTRRERLGKIIAFVVLPFAIASGGRSVGRVHDIRALSGVQQRAGAACTADVPITLRADGMWTLSNGEFLYRCRSDRTLEIAYTLDGDDIRIHGDGTLVINELRLRPNRSCRWACR